MVLRQQLPVPPLDLLFHSGRLEGLQWPAATCAPIAGTGLLRTGRNFSPLCLWHCHEVMSLSQMEAENYPDSTEGLGTTMY